MIRPLRTSHLVIDIVLAAVFAVIVLPVELAVGGLDVRGVIGSIVLVSLMAAALAVRRLAPGLALGAAWVGALAQMSLLRVPGLADVAVFAVLFTAAAYGTRRVRWAGFASAIGGALLAAAYIELVLGARPVSGQTAQESAMLVATLMFALVLSWTAGLLLHTTRRAREDRAAQQRAQDEAAAEQERTRIARDMHDVVAHSLAVVIAQADGARYAGAADPQAQAQALQTISTTARAALTDVRVLLAQLRHRQGDGPQPGVGDLDELFARMHASGMDLRVDIDPAPRTEPPSAVQRAVYRILQEALTNALRHGGDGPVDVHLAWHDDGVELSVRNVRGSARPGGDSDGRGHGLIGMRERASLVGGDLQAAAEGAAFIVRARLPIAAG